MIFTPLSFLSVAYVSVVAMTVLFGIKILVTNRFRKKLVSEYPVILVTGTSEKGKKDILKKITPVDVRTNIVPYVGRVHSCDMTIRQQNFRMVCFHSLTAKHEIKCDCIHMTDKEPRMVVFAGSAEDMGSQKRTFDEIRGAFPDAPAIVVFGSDLDKEKIREAKKTFGKDIYLSEEDDSLKMRAAIERGVFSSPVSGIK